MQKQVFALTALVLVVSVSSAATGQTKRLSNSKDFSGVSGWYVAEGDRHLTILPNEKDVVAVFFWRTGAPTSVGKLSKT
ncbi:MAG TPA: hypothetical protein DIW81_24225, partial [Planctomycetaceae bacterium]|nr:hypothetical protein [Planctomycetaceae bacterium]